MAEKTFKSGSDLSTASVTIWRTVQTLVWLIGIFIFLSLIFYPTLGLNLFWNVLIPVAPLLLVISVGTWRNVCPLATTNLLPRHFNLSKKKKMPELLQSKLGLVSVISLYLIVPLRHVILNNSGIATATLLFVAAVVGLSMGFFYDWKSGWCSSLCPVHPVEKLYGGNTLISLPNAHCDLCVNCTVPCPDSTPNVHPKIVQKNNFQKLSGILLVGGFPGFVWGWFHVPDQVGVNSISELLSSYKIPFTGLLVTLAIYIVLIEIFKKLNDRTIISIFGAAAISCYYWYRLPNLFGFGMFGKDGMLVDLRNVLPEWSITALIVILTVFFFYWLVF